MVSRNARAVLAFSLVAGGAGWGQGPPALSLSLRDSDPPELLVQAQELLQADFIEGLRSGFPLHVVYRATLKEARPFKDRKVSEFVWEYVVLFDPVRDRFAVESPDGTEILPDRRVLGRRIATVYVVGLEPDRSGNFYYEGAVEARMLSDEDVDEAFAWLRGENSDSVRLKDPGFFARFARRVLVRASALPRVRLEARTDEFRLP
jgi:hypothetical protein